MASSPNKRLTDDPFKESTGGLDLLIPKNPPIEKDAHTDENTSSPEPAGEPIERRPSKSIKNPKGAGRPRVINRVTTKTSRDGLRDGLTRATFIVPEKILAEIKEIVFKDEERRPLKYHIAEALSDYVKKIKNKEVK